MVLMSDWPEKDVKFAKDMLIKDSINTSNFTGMYPIPAGNDPSDL